MRDANRDAARCAAEPEWRAANAGRECVACGAWLRRVAAAWMRACCAICCHRRACCGWGLSFAHGTVALLRRGGSALGGGSRETETMVDESTASVVSAKQKRRSALWRLRPMRMPPRRSRVWHCAQICPSGVSSYRLNARAHHETTANAHVRATLPPRLRGETSRRVGLVLHG